MNLQFIDPEQGLRLLDSKKEFGQLFCFSLGLDIVCRPLKLSETEAVSSLRDKVPDYLIDEWIVRNTLVYCSRSVDHLFDGAPAGLVATVANKLLDISNVKTEKEFTDALGKARESGAVSDIIESFISAAFHSLSPADIRNMTQAIQMRHLVSAEALLGKKLELGTPEKPDPKGKKGKKRSPEVDWMLSPEAADKPDFEKDNRDLGAV